MLATLSTTQKAMTACQSGAQPMPFSQPSIAAMCTMYMAAASILIIETGALASVSFFVVVLLVVALLLVSLVVLISLLLTGLTGLIRLESLVGLTNGMTELATSTTRTTRGD